VGRAGEIDAHGTLAHATGVAAGGPVLDVACGNGSLAVPSTYLEAAVTRR
jgi:2-polyprenyl-3-methyl-5-hydroxy-6-metoxy-1,4-benzoquinol methylase